MGVEACTCSLTELHIVPDDHTPLNHMQTKFVHMHAKLAVSLKYDSVESWVHSWGRDPDANIGSSL